VARFTKKRQGIQPDDDATHISDRDVADVRCQVESGNVLLNRDLRLLIILPVLARACRRSRPRPTTGICARPGNFVRLTVCDTGQGMTAEILSRAMEPFFTTKEHGTGLGLATVYGAAQQSRGFVAIRSAVGKGTTVQLYFPKAEAKSSVRAATSATRQAPLGHGERILVVEDNDKVREATVGRLQSLGYAVLQVRTGSEAAKLLESGEPIALVFSDIVMPGRMTGYDVAEWIRSKKPGVKVILSSGYSNVPLAASEAVRGIRVIDKPYTREQLAHALDEALNS